MKKNLLFLPLLLALCIAHGQKKPAHLKSKQKVIASIESKYDDLTALSDKIWSYEEEAFQESQSAKALIEFAKANGFRVNEGVAEIPTAFTAEFGSGTPIIGIMGEFDALPGLSQKKSPI